MTITKDDLYKEIWSRGLLKELLWPQQKELYEFLDGLESDFAVFNCPRRFGKSFTLLTYAVMMCILYPGFKVKYGAPTSVQADEIIHDTMPEVLINCPEELLPDFMASKKRYIFKHADDRPSEIKIVGLEAGYGKGLRGSKANLIIIDEAGFVNRLTYIIESIAQPLVDKMTYAKIFICSTPSEDASHNFFDWVDRAHAKGCYLKRTVYDDLIEGEESIKKKIERATLRDKEGNVLQEAHDNPNFQREYLCERLSDPEALIFPEYLRVEKEIVFDLKPTEYRPDYYEPMVVFDWGWKDFDGGLYGYVDFEKACLVIEAETWTNYTVASDLGKIIRGKTAELWPKIKDVKDITFYADNDPKQIAEIRKETDLMFRPVDTQFDKYPVISSMRSLMSGGRIKVHDRCEQLKYQLKNGMWQMTRTGVRKNDFIRNKKVGHCDLLMALLYMYKKAKFNSNPYPTDFASGQDTFNRSDKYQNNKWDLLKGNRHGRINATNRR